MRIYGSVPIVFWANAETQSLSDQGKLLAIYLLTGPHSNMMGCFRMPDGYINEDLRWNNQIVKKAFQQLSIIDFLTRDESSSWVVIHDFLKWNPIQNPRQGMGIQKLFSMVPTESRVFKPLIKGLLTHGKYLDQGFHDRLHTLKGNAGNPLDTPEQKCIADQEQNQDQEQDQKILMSGKPDVVFLKDHLSDKKI